MTLSRVILANLLTLGSLIAVLLVQNSTASTPSSAFDATAVLDRYDIARARVGAYWQTVHYYITEESTGQVRLDRTERVWVDFTRGSAFDESGVQIGTALGLDPFPHPPSHVIKLVDASVSPTGTFYTLEIRYQGGKSVDVITLDGHSFLPVHRTSTSISPDKNGVIVRTHIEFSFGELRETLP